MANPKILSIAIPYDNFQTPDVINPEEFNINNAEIAVKVNEIVRFLNSIVGGGVVDNIRGDVIGISPIPGFTEENVEEFLKAFTERLRSSEEPSGAKYIGAEPMEGTESTDVQGQLKLLRTLLNTIVGDVSGDKESLARHVLSGDHDVRYHTKQQVDDKLALKTDLTGDHKGTWNGVHHTDLVTNKSLVIPVLNADPIGAPVGQIWIRGDL